MSAKPRGRAERPAHLLAAATLGALLLAPTVPALADVPFAVGSPPVLGPAVSNQGSQIWVDANGDGLETPGDTHHPVPSGIDLSWTLRLSPSRRVVTATMHDGGTCPGGTTHFRVFEVPLSDAPLVERGAPMDVAGCFNDPVFFDPGLAAPVRTAFFQGTGNLGSAPYLWWDLVTGSRATSPFPYTTPLGYVQFSPTGTMAFVQHDVNGPGGSNYSIVTLCPASIGQASQPGLEYNGALDAWYVPGTPPIVQARQNSTVVGTFLYDGCSVSIPLGACCMPDGSCSDTQQSACAGTWHPEGLCATVTCPGASLAVTMTGPASATRGTPVTYTLTASNSGALASNGVLVTDILPTGATFVSATNGGAYSAPTRQVSWALGTLGAGSQRTLGLTVQAPCAGTAMSNVAYTISGTPGGSKLGTPAVTTTLLAPVGTGLSITLISQALAPTPLQTGDRVRHTVRLANTGAAAQPGLRFQVAPGYASTIAQVVSAGGGTVTSSPSSLSWTGDLPAASTLDVVYETAILECRGAQPPAEMLNRGILVALYNACNSLLVYATPTQSFPVAPSPFSAWLESTSHGPAQSWSGGTPIVLCRPGDDLDVDLLLANVSGSASPPASLSMTLPAELAAAMDPPFTSAPPPGVTWDASSQTLSFAGSFPANDTLRVSLRVHADTAACSSMLSGYGTVGTCSGMLRPALNVFMVPEPPASHLLALHNVDGLWYLDPASGSDWKPLLCARFEYLRGFGRTNDGTIWVAGIPSFRLNPRTLEFQILPLSFSTTLGMDYLFDAAGDPRDGTVVFGGYQSGLGLRLRRYDPATGQVTVVLDDTTPQSYGIARHVVVGPDGLIGVNNNNGVLRVNPANPGNPTLITLPIGDGLNGLSFDVDGRWLASTHPTGSGAPRELVAIDPATGAYESLLDVHGYFTWYIDTPAIATTPGRVIYQASGDAVLARIDRDAGNTVTTSPVVYNITDLMWVGPATTAVAPPAPGEAPPAFALGAPKPNPSRGDVTLDFSLPVAARVSLAVYDVGGRRVRSLLDGDVPAGRHVAAWNGRGDDGAPLGPGLYFVRLMTAEGTRRARVVLAR